MVCGQSSSVVLLLALITQMATVRAPNGRSVDTNETFPAEETCRDRMNHLPIVSFRLTTCANCYLYLFMDDPSKVLFPEDGWLVHSNISRIEADINSDDSRTEICSTLTEEECQRWESCCREAERCCSRQRERPAPAVGPADGGHPTAGKPLCPQTWDGFGCWDYSPPGKVASGLCPEYIQYAVPTEKSYKECTVNGTWYLHPESDLEWTDYSSCISLENLKRSTITSIVCNVISLVALIPSVTIFICYRPLRCQNRIRLHVNLFLSFILYGIVALLWDVAIVLDRIETASSMTAMNQNSGGCKMLYVLSRYSRMANFLWMVCEAVYLHRLLVKAFEPPKNLIFFYVTGWVFPWVPVVAYTVLRFLFANTSCWIKPFGSWEWLIYVPNLLALLVNLVVLLDILRILVTQVQSLQNELNSNRRALKAMFILVPLFGLQLFLVIYRPPYQSAIGRHYEMIAAFVVNLQGLFVSLIYCLANGEVMSHLSRSWQRLTAKIHRQDFGRVPSLSSATHSELFSLTSRRDSASATASSNHDHRRSSLKTIALNGRNHGVTDCSDVSPRRHDDVAKQPADCVVLVADLGAIEEVDEVFE